MHANLLTKYLILIKYVILQKYSVVSLLKGYFLCFLSVYSYLHVILAIK